MAFALLGQSLQFKHNTDACATISDIFQSQIRRFPMFEIQARA